MDIALRLARMAGQSGEVPVGAVVLSAGGAVIAQGWNTREARHDPTGHAEIMALQAAGTVLNSWRLLDCTMVVTLEPCVMCAGAISQARLGRLVFGAWDPKMGAVGSVWDVLRDRQSQHWVEVWPGLRADECRELLADFFERRRLR